MKSVKSTVKRTNEEDVIKILSEQAPAGVCIMQDGKFCYINSFFSITTGYTADELVGKDSFALVAPEDREMVRENTLKMLKGETLAPYHFRVTCKDGRIIWVMSTVKSIQYHGKRAVLGNYMEITERRQIEEALKESKERYEELANSITDVFFAMDEHLRYTYWNKTSEILTGIRAKDAIGKSLREIFPDTLGTRNAEKMYRKVLKTRQPQTFVNDYDINGRHYIFEISAYPSRGGISVFVKDITEHKQAEEKLKESEQKYRLLFETSPDYITQLDREGRYLAANPATARSLGVPLEELIGKTVFEVMPQEVAQLRFENMRKVFDEGHPQIFEDEREGRYFHHIVVPTKTSEQKEAVQVITRDITERKQAEEKLRQSEENYKTLFNSSGVGMYVLDAETFKVVMGNRAAAEMAGFSSPGEGIGINPLDFVVPEDRAQVLEVAAKEFEQDLRRTHEVRVVGKDGRRGWINISSARIMHEGRPAALVSISNITERKLAEEKLKESEQKYRTILEEMGNSYFETDLAGNLTFVNDALIRRLGYSQEELIGMNFRALRSKEEAKAVFEAYNRVYKTGEPLRDFFTEVVCKDGRHIFGETSIFPIRNEKSEIIGFRGISRDITERRKMEEALRQSEEKHRALFDSSVIGMFVLDAETTKIVMCNQAAAKMFGFSSIEEAIGINPVDFIHPEEREKDLDIIIKDMFEQNLRQTHEFRALTKDGREGWISVTGARIMHEGRLAGLVSITNINRRKRSEEALRQSEEKYRTILENMEDSYFEVDLAGNITFVNNSACRDLGYSREELIGRNYKAYTTEEDIESVFQVFNEVYRTGVSNKGYSWKTTRKDGSHGFAETSASPLRNNKGEIVGFRGVGRDVTERKQAEEKIRESEQKYRLLFETSPDCITQIDREGRYLAANPATAKSLGVPVEELIGKTIFEVMPQNVAQYRLGMIRKALDEWQPQSFEDERAGRYFSHIYIPTKISEQKEAIYGIARDITERKQAEEALRQSEEKYRTILEGMEDAYFEVDLGGHLTFANNAVCRDLGYSKEELIGMSYKDYTAKEDIESVFRVFNEVYRTDVPNKGFAWKTIRKDGVQGFAETSISLLRNSKSEIIGFRGVGRDVTERKQTEEKLRQSEENYKTLFNSSVVGMYVMDIETSKIVMGNRAAQEMVGFSSSEAGIGVNPFDFVVPEDRDKVLDIAINEFLQDSRRTHEVQVMDKNGRRRWNSFSIARITHQGRLASLVSVVDITERKQAEEKLRQSEANYRALFDSAVIGTLVLDAETTKVVLANQAAAKIFEFSSVEEGIGVNVLDYVSLEEKGKVIELIMKDLFERDLRTTHEIQAITKNGRTIWISVTGARIVHQGKLAGLLSFTDITERKQAEDKLRQSKENYRALFESSVIGAVVVDAETMEIIMANQATLKMFGFSSPEAGVNPLDFSPLEDRQRNLELIVKEVFEKDSRESTDLPVMTKDGRKIWVSVTGARITYKGKVAGLLSFTDITERKQAEEKLRQSEENYRALFDSAVIGTVLLDAETMKIAMANQAAVKMFGFSSVEEVLGIEPFSFILPEDKERYIELATKAVFEQNTHEPFEIRAVGKDGRERWINTTATVITYKGNPTGLISFADITEQKKQSERLMMTDRLASLGELASGTAHELNNPLTSIIGFSQLLMEREVPDDIREDLKLINNEAQRAASVTKNLLTFARKHAPAKQRNQINSIIEDVLKLRAYEHKANNIEVERQFAPDLPEIMVDYFQMQQVFMNIVINSEYFMIKAHNKGTLTITTQKQGDTVLISFADDGPGVPPENLRRIFDPFFTTKEAGKGTGLGLSICHGIVTEHGGHIYARSQLGKGTTFFVELPISS